MEVRKCGNEIGTPRRSKSLPFRVDPISEGASSWCLGRVAVCDCGIPGLLPFLGVQISKCCLSFTNWQKFNSVPNCLVSEYLG